MASVTILNEVMIGEPEDWRLCFHRCTYHYDNGEEESGFRFIWRRPNGNLQAARGQARIPSSINLQNLLELATNAGWYN